MTLLVGRCSWCPGLLVKRWTLLIYGSNLILLPYLIWYYHIYFATSFKSAVPTSHRGGRELKVFNDQAQSFVHWWLLHHDMNVVFIQFLWKFASTNPSSCAIATSFLGENRTAVSAVNWNAIVSGRREVLWLGCYINYSCSCQLTLHIYGSMARRAQSRTHISRLVIQRYLNSLSDFPALGKPARLLVFPEYK